jgi:phage head maturation protease
MSATTERAMERLQSVLDAPVRQRSPQVRELAEHRAQHGRPDDVIVKQAVVAEAAPPETDTHTGTFTALVSDYETDREGDRFLPGAWDKAIATIRKAGRPLPVLFGHDTRSVGSVIGLVQADDVWADAEGLWIKGWLDTGDTLGRRLYRMVEKGYSPGASGSVSPAISAATTASTNSSRSASCTRSAQPRSPRTRGPQRPA